MQNIRMVGRKSTIGARMMVASMGCRGYQQASIAH